MPIVDLERVKEQGKRFVDGFTPGQKAMTILGVVAVVFAGMTFMKWASAPDYAPLYTGLSSQDAGAVTQALDSANVKYKLTGGGGTILVARQDVYKTRADLSTKGLPNGGGDSFALLDKQGITTDQFTRNVDYQRALQGELGKTIEAIDGVTSASVTLTIPQETVFVGANQDKPTAAVLVKSNGTMDDSTVQAIVHIVASSIPNMIPDDVTVADASGKVLHAPGVDSSAASGGEIEQKQQYETAIEKKVSDMIAATLGPGHAAVTVSADLDMSKSTSHNINYTNPNATGAPPAIQSSSKNTTLTQNGGNSTQGPLGVGNVTATPVAGSGTSNYKETDNTVNNAINSSVTDATTPPGTLKRLSVSVLLDNSKTNVTPADVTNIWQPQIANAAGILASRDGANAVQVTAIPFTDDAKKAAAAATTTPASASNPMFDLIKHVLTLLMIGLVLFFAWRAIKRAEANRTPLRVPIDLRELEAPTPNMLDAAALAAAVAAPAARRPLEPPPQTLEGEISELIERQPEEVAQTLRSWLADRRG